MVPYAVERTKTHLLRFNQIYDDFQLGTINATFLDDIETIDNIFPNMDYRVYRFPGNREPLK